MTASPTGPYESLDYCALEDVTGRLYSGQGLLGAASPPTDATRDAILKGLITTVSRDFDEEVWGNQEYPGLFSWRLETRLYSGVGQQDLSIGPFAKLAKIEVDATPGQISHTFQDYTLEVEQNRIGFKPIRGFPKKVIFRQSTFYVDPFRLGNVRLTGIWGIVQPNGNAPAPNEDWEDTYLDGVPTNATANGGIPTVASLSPDGGGWWTTPDDVRGAVATWVTFKFQSAKMAGGATTGTGAGKMTNDKAIPPDVKRVITRYSGQHNVPQFALVADDGSDVDQQGQYPVWRWAGWMTHS